MNATSRPQLDPSRLHLKFSLIEGRPQSKLRDRHAGEEVLVGAGKVQLFGRAPGPWTIAWYENEASPRQRTTRTSYKQAKAFRDQKITELSNRATGLSQLNPKDGAIHLQALENLAPTSQSILTATAEHARREKILKDKQITFDGLIGFWDENRPRIATAQPLPGVVEEYLAEKKPILSKDHYTHRSRQLRKLGTWFTGPVHALQRVDVDIWIRGLSLGPITRKSYRDAARELMRYAEAMGYIQTNHPLLAKIRTKDRYTPDIKILTPKQCADLITNVPESLAPFIYLQAFAGLRHIEVKRLDWKDVHIDDEEAKEHGPHIYISKSVAKKTNSKTGGDRVVPIAANLEAWIMTCIPNSREGPIVTVAQTSGALTKAKRAAGIPAGRNQTKNILRKTWISHRLGATQNRAQVAEEAGNSPGVIRKYYGQPMPKTQGKALFQIWPTDASVRQLNFPGL